MPEWPEEILLGKSRLGGLFSNWFVAGAELRLGEVLTPYVQKAKLEEVERERDERLKVPPIADEAEVEKLAKEYAEWSSDRPWDERHPKNREHWRKVARVLIVAQADGFPKVNRADQLQAILDALVGEEAVEALAKHLHSARVIGTDAPMFWGHLTDDEREARRESARSFIKDDLLQAAKKQAGGGGE